MSEQFCLRWNNHQSTLISVFETLLESGSLIDCTLCAEGQLLKAHKVVLSACSPIFESMLCIQEDKHPIIFLKDVKFIELKAMLDYMYKGEVNILQDQLDSFLRTAAALQIKGLTDQGGGGGDEPPAKKGPGRKTGMSDVAPESPLVGNAPLREGSVSPTRRRRRIPRRPSSAEDASADNSCDIPPPAVAPPAITPATGALPVSEPLHRSSLSATTVKAKQEPIDTPLVTPKQEFVEETNEEIEDLTLDDDDDYNDSMSDMSKPGTSFGAMNPGSTSQQDFSQWQQMMGAADRSGTDEVFMAAQEAINNQTNTQDEVKKSKEEKRKLEKDSSTEKSPKRFKIPKLNRTSEQNADNTKNDSPKKYVITLKKKAKKRELKSPRKPKGTKKYEPSPVVKVDASKKYEPTPLNKVDEQKVPKRYEPTPVSKSEEPKASKRYEPTSSSKSEEPKTSKRHEPTSSSKSDEPKASKRSEPNLLSKGEEPKVHKRYEPTPLQKADALKKYESSSVLKVDVTKKYEPAPVLKVDITKKNEPIPSLKIDVSRKHDPGPVQKVDAAMKYEPTPLPKDDEFKASKRHEPISAVKSDALKKYELPPLPLIDTPAYEPTPVQNIDVLDAYEPTPLPRTEATKKIDPISTQKSDIAQKYELPTVVVTDAPAYEPTSIEVLNKYEPTPLQKIDAAKKLDLPAPHKSDVTKKFELPAVPIQNIDSGSKYEPLPVQKIDASKKYELPPLPTIDTPTYEPTSIQKIDSVNLYEPTPLQKSDTLLKYEPTKLDKKSDKRSDKKESRKESKREHKKSDLFKKIESPKKLAEGGKVVDTVKDAGPANPQRHEPVLMKNLPLPPLPKEPSPQPIPVLNSEDAPVFACSFCSKSFHKKELLKRHTRYECGLEPMARDETSCPHCPYKAADKQALKSHISIKHYVPW